MMQPDRDEHLRWCKERALALLDDGELREAVSSMISNLTKHPDFCGPTYDMLAMVGMMTVAEYDSAGARRWIEGFN